MKKRIVPANAAGQIGRKKLRHLVKDLAIVLQALETMGEAGGDIKLAVVLCGELESLPLAEGGGITAHIQDHVENFSGRASDELDFGLGRRLEMHATDRATQFCQGEVALRPARVQTQRDKLMLAKGAGEETPLVLAQFEFDEP